MYLWNIVTVVVPDVVRDTYNMIGLFSDFLNEREKSFEEKERCYDDFLERLDLNNETLTKEQITERKAMINLLSKIFSGKEVPISKFDLPIHRFPSNKWRIRAIENLVSREVLNLRIENSVAGNEGMIISSNMPRNFEHNRRGKLLGRDFGIAESRYTLPDYVKPNYTEEQKEKIYDDLVENIKRVHPRSQKIGGILDKVSKILAGEEMHRNEFQFTMGVQWGLSFIDNLIANGILIKKKTGNLIILTSGMSPDFEHNRRGKLLGRDLGIAD